MRKDPALIIPGLLDDYVMHVPTCDELENDFMANVPKISTSQL
jgi:hypothetical protein